MLYYRRKQERASDRLPLKLLLKVGALSPVVFPFPSVPLGGSVCPFSPLLYGIGLVVLPITAVVFMVVSFLTAWKENTHASWRDDSMTVEKTLAARK